MNEDKTVIDTRPAKSWKAEMWEKIAKLKADNKELLATTKIMSDNMSLHAMWFRELNERVERLEKEKERMACLIAVLGEGVGIPMEELFREAEEKYQEMKDDQIMEALQEIKRKNETGNP